MNKDDLLLSEAYSQVYNEGIWDRLKGQASGIGAGLKQGAQNVASKAAGALGADVKPSGETMGGSYANAQQTSLVNSFIKKAQKEIADFNNDISKMGVNPNEEQFPEIKAQLDSVNNLIAFLQNPQGTPPSASTNQPATQPAAPTAPAATQPAAPEPKASEKAQLAASTPSGTGPLTVQNKTLATPQQATGVVSGVPKNTQTTATPGGTTNTSFSMANQQPKQVNQLPKEAPVQKAFTPPAEQDAEIVEPKQASSGTPQAVRGAMEQQFGPAKSEIPDGETVQFKGQTYVKSPGISGWNLLKKGSTPENPQAGANVPKEIKSQLDAEWKKQQATKAKSSADLTAGGMNPNIRTK